MSATPREAPYGHWDSPLSAERVFQGSETVSFPRPCAGGNGLFFLLSLPEEGNANALFHLSPGGVRTRVSPPGFNLRSRVHEYGALPYAFAGESVFYCNFSDQAVWKQAFDPRTGSAGEAVALTPASTGADCALRYGDFLHDPRRGRLICVREDHRGGGEPLNTLVAIDTARGGEGEVLFEGTDFVASPRLSEDGANLVFQTWMHPDMPWDDTRILIADLDAEGAINRGNRPAGESGASLREVRKPKPGSLVQPLFHPDGDLYFIADWSDWWNLYRVPAASLQGDCRPEAVLPLPAECCPPQWLLGQRSYAFLDTRRLLLSINRRCFWEAALLDLDTRQLSSLREGLCVPDGVSGRDGKVLFAAATPAAPAAIHEIDPASPAQRHRLLFQPRNESVLAADVLSLPEHLSYPTGDGESAHGLFYPPRNPGWLPEPGSLPPLIVSVHGGPTSSARVAFNPALQFWTTRGFAVLDVNHRGSTGYGRRYRRRLYGDWGIADVADVVSAVRQLVASKRVDGGRIFIRGGSAGGYVVLAALANSELFRGGASYYGISDLELLAADTHKFESRYLDRLIGPWPEAAQRYRERSPIHAIERIRAPVLLLQGMEDKVVPPNQAQGLFERLRERNPGSRLLCFPDEGHGFRRPSNQVAALQAELDFYRGLLR